MLGGIAVQDLDLVTVLQVNSGISSFLFNEEFHMESEIPVFLFGHNICRTVFMIHHCRIIAAHHSPFIHRIVHNFPFDGHLSGKPGTFPVDPVLMK